MLTQNQIKHLTALKQKKFREQYQQFVAEGHKLVSDLAGSSYQLEGIFATGDWIVENQGWVTQRKLTLVQVSEKEMERISGLATPSPVMAVINLPGQSTDLPELVAQIGEELSLALDDIRDPGNLGTMIRIADWFGIGTILCSENCVEIHNPKVIQSTMGSIARVKVLNCNLAEILRMVNGPVYGMLLEGESLYERQLETRGIILIGNESRGISAELKPFVTEKLHIPPYGNNLAGKAESLNASVATAIVCAEFRRRVAV